MIKSWIIIGCWGLFSLCKQLSCCLKNVLSLGSHIYRLLFVLSVWKAASVCWLHQRRTHYCTFRWRCWCRNICWVYRTHCMHLFLQWHVFDVKPVCVHVAKACFSPRPVCCPDLTPRNQFLNQNKQNVAQLETWPDSPTCLRPQSEKSPFIHLLPLMGVWAPIPACPHSSSCRMRSQTKSSWRVLALPRCVLSLQREMKTYRGRRLLMPEPLQLAPDEEEQSITPGWWSSSNL